MGLAINTACHTINHVYFCLGTKKISYEQWKGKKPNVCDANLNKPILRPTIDVENFNKKVLKSDCRMDVTSPIFGETIVTRELVVELFEYVQCVKIICNV